MIDFTPRCKYCNKEFTKHDTIHLVMINGSPEFVCGACYKYIFLNDIYHFNKN